MNKKYNISEDFNELIKMVENRGKITSQEEAIKMINEANRLGKIALENNKSNDEVKVTKKKIKSFDGEEINVQIIEPQNIGNNAPCLIYYHGGGFVSGPMEAYIKAMPLYALKVNCKVVFVDYRLALEYPFPTGVEDCYSALLWVHENAQSLGIDVNKIAVGGDSAGGALSAAVSQMTLDRKGPKICFQMLNYPVTDNRQITKSVREFVDTPIINSQSIKTMWQAYLRNGDKGMIEYAAPMLRKSFKGLPSAYVEVAEFDPLRDEGIEYAKAMKEDGVSVEFVQTKGTVHGYDMIQTSSITKESIGKRVRALKNAFSIE